MPRSNTSARDRRRFQHRRRVAALCGVAAAFAFPAAALASPSNFEQGRAYDLKLKMNPFSTAATVGPDTGFINTNQSSNTSLSAATLHTSIGDASALNASVVTDASTETSTSNASLVIASLHIPGLPTIGAGLISSKSTTSCRDHRTVSGSSVLGQITVNGKTYNIASPPNTTIPVGIGTIVLNQQTPIPNGLTVNAIHVTVPSLGVDVVVSSSSSAVTNCA